MAAISPPPSSSPCSPKGETPADPGETPAMDQTDKAKEDETYGVVPY